MKEIGTIKLGDKGSIAFSVATGDITMAVTYEKVKNVTTFPIIDLVEPLKDKILGTIQRIIPGDYENAVLEKGWDEVLEFFGVKPKTVATIAAPTPEAAV